MSDSRDFPGLQLQHLKMREKDPEAYDEAYANWLADPYQKAMREQFEEDLGVLPNDTVEKGWGIAAGNLLWRIARCTREHREKLHMGSEVSALHYGQIRLVCAQPPHCPTYLVFKCIGAVSHLQVWQYHADGKWRSHFIECEDRYINGGNGFVAEARRLDEGWKIVRRNLLANKRECEMSLPTFSNAWGGENWLFAATTEDQATQQTLLKYWCHNEYGELEVAGEVIDVVVEDPALVGQMRRVLVVVRSDAPYCYRYNDQVTVLCVRERPEAAVSNELGWWTVHRDQRSIEHVISLNGKPIGGCNIGGPEKCQLQAFGKYVLLLVSSTNVCQLRAYGKSGWVETRTPHWMKGGSTFASWPFLLTSRGALVWVEDVNPNGIVLRELHDARPSGDANPRSHLHVYNKWFVLLHWRCSAGWDALTLLDRSLNDVGATIKTGAGTYVPQMAHVHVDQNGKVSLMAVVNINNGRRFLVDRGSGKRCGYIYREIPNAPHYDGTHVVYPALTDDRRAVYVRYPTKLN